MEPSSGIKAQSGPSQGLSEPESDRGSTNGFGPVRTSSEVRQRVRADRLSRVTGVTILPPRGEQAEKRSFRLLLSLDSSSDPSSH